VYCLKEMLEVDVRSGLKVFKDGVLSLSENMWFNEGIGGDKVETSVRLIDQDQDVEV
jgi:hypothetical protein